MIELSGKVSVNTFQTTIETWVHKKGMGYLEAIMFFCEENNVEIDAVANLIKKSDVIRTKLEAECEYNNILHKQPRLPV